MRRWLGLAIGVSITITLILYNIIRDVKAVPCILIDNKCAPTFFIIGAFKTGTTSMYTYLSNHPQVDVLRSSLAVRDVQIKETGHFLWNKSTTPESLRGYMNKYFPVITPSDRTITGEASPAYIYHPDTPRYLHSVFPKARLILLVRDPVDTIHSRIKHYISLRCGHSNLSSFCRDEVFSQEFDALMDIELPIVKSCLQPVYSQFTKCLVSRSKAIQGNTFVKMTLSLQAVAHSLFILQLENWLKYFSPEQILIVKSEDLYTNPTSVMNRVTTHLHLPAIDWTEIVKDKYNVGLRESQRRSNRGKEAGIIREAGGGQSRHHMTERIRDDLEEFFEPYNTRLGEYMGLEGSPW